MSICWAILVSAQDEPIARAIIKVLNALGRELFAYIISESNLQEIYPKKLDSIPSAYAAHTFRTYCSREKMIPRILIVETNTQSLSPEFLPWMGMFGGKLAKEVLCNISDVLKNILKSERDTSTSIVLCASFLKKANELEKLIKQFWSNIMLELRHEKGQKTK